jgi:hypothetical protein
LGTLPQGRVSEVVVGTSRQTRVVQEEKIYRTVEVRAVLGRALTRDAVGAAGLTVKRHSRSDELPVWTGRVADRGADVLVVDCGGVVGAGEALVEAEGSAGETADRTGVACVKGGVLPEAYWTVEEALGVVEVQVEAVLGEAAGSAVGGAAHAGLALGTTEEAEVAGGVLVLSVGAIGRANISVIL